ncbi:MAG: ABC-type transport auxiliary lipoprotein family protein [Pseudomonadota bacterium]
MRFLSSVLLITLASLLSGCGETQEPVRFATPASPPVARVSIPLSSIAVREVSLPSYATEEGVATVDASGAIIITPDTLWADEPSRAVTLRLTSALADATGRVVASDPWPFSANPDAVVEVRVETFIAEEAGRFVAEGRYYVAHEDEERTDHAHKFELIEPFDPARGFPGIAAARAEVIAALAEDIARRGLR